MREEELRRKGDKRKKSSREIRVKTHRKSKERPPSLSDDMLEVQREIARNQGFDICPDCQQYTPLDNPQCIHCHQ